MISLRRIIRLGWTNFVRNLGPNLIVVFILLVVISLITSLYLLQRPVQFLISSLQEKVDITVYFKEGVPEEEILTVKEDLSKFPEVESLEFISQEEALEKFTRRHQEEPLLMESLEELGINPFLASLNIRAADPSQYELIAAYLEGESFDPLIEKIDYYQKKPLLDRLHSIAYRVNVFFIISAIVLGIISILVAFFQFQLSIHNSSQEISTMRLVGASNFFIKGPFVIQGIIVGFLAGLVALLIFSGLLFFSDSKIETTLPGLNLFDFFASHLLIIFLIQGGVGVGLGILASLIVIKRYLKV